MKNPILILFLSLVIPFVSIAQIDQVDEATEQSLSQFIKSSQFGIVLEVHNTNPTLEQNDPSELGLIDELNSVKTGKQLGIGLGMLYGYEFNDLFSIRTQPMINFSKSEFIFDLNNESNESLVREMVNLTLPIHIVLENRTKKVSPSLLLGGSYKYNIAQNTRTAQLNGNYKHSDLAIEAGAGLSFKFEDFRFKTELIYAHGLLNQIGNNPARTVASALSKSTNNQIALRFMFYM